MRLSRGGDSGGSVFKTSVVLLRVSSHGVFKTL